MNDWTEQVQTDLRDFGITVDLEFIKKRSVFSFKSLVKRKSKEFAFYKFLEKKEEHSKLDNLFYKNLSIQNYLYDEKISYSQALSIFSFWTRVDRFSENHPGKQWVKTCPFCQNHSFQCQKIKENIDIKGNYRSFLSEKWTQLLTKLLKKFSKFQVW